MVGSAVVCVDDDLAFKVISANLRIQGWTPQRANAASEAIESARQTGATLLIICNNAIWPTTNDELQRQLAQEPGSGKVKVINLDIKSPLPPSIFSNPKGPLPPAIAVRPVDWLMRSHSLK